MTLLCLARYCVPDWCKLPTVHSGHTLSRFTRTKKPSGALKYPAYVMYHAHSMCAKSFSHTHMGCICVRIIFFLEQRKLRAASRTRTRGYSCETPRGRAERPDGPSRDRETRECIEYTPPTRTTRAARDGASITAPYTRRGRWARPGRSCRCGCRSRATRSAGRRPAA